MYLYPPVYMISYILYSASPRLLFRGASSVNRGYIQNQYRPNIRQRPDPMYPTTDEARRCIIEVRAKVTSRQPLAEEGRFVR